MIKTDCFKSCDIRGRVGTDLTADFAYALGLSVANILRPTSVVTGRDTRLSSPELQQALAEGLSAAGVAVHDIGLCGTEEVYFATDHLSAGAGLMVTASHKPAPYNGFKFVAEGTRPLSDSEFRAIKAWVATDPSPESGAKRGRILAIDVRKAYSKRIVSFIDPRALAPLRIVVNAGNGAAGPTFDAVMKQLQPHSEILDIIRVNYVPDGTFPNGIPNPLLPKNHDATGAVVRASKADFGIAWDGDFDRCFFFDESGRLVPGE